MTLYDTYTIKICPVFTVWWIENITWAFPYQVLNIAPRAEGPRADIGRGLIHEPIPVYNWPYMIFYLLLYLKQKRKYTMENI